MYKIFLDKNKTFECNVKIEGAALDQSEARLLLEGEGFVLLFKGSIGSDGTVKIPIGRLKGIVKENHTGKISLEVIAEDTVFKPWESDYQADVSKKVEVDFGGKLTEDAEEHVEAKPKISFSIVPDEFDTRRHLDEISKILRKNGVTGHSLSKNKAVFDRLVETYCSLNYINDAKNVDSIKKELLNKIRL